MTFIKSIDEGTQLPFGHGYICLNPGRYKSWLVAPMPFHWVIRKWYEYLEHLRPAAWEKRIQSGLYEAYLRGLAEGGRIPNQEIEQAMDKLDRLQRVVDTLLGKEQPDGRNQDM